MDHAGHRGQSPVWTGKGALALQWALGFSPITRPVMRLSEEFHVASFGNFGQVLAKVRTDSGRGFGFFEQRDEGQGGGSFHQPGLDPFVDLVGQVVTVTRNNNDVGHGGIAHRNFAEFGNAQYIELPHLVTQMAFATEIFDEEIIGLLRVLASLKILVSDEDVERRVRFGLGRIRRDKGKRVLHGSENDPNEKKLQWGRNPKPIFFDFEARKRERPRSAGYFFNENTRPAMERSPG
jgi:hypothetical protein